MDFVANIALCTFKQANQLKQKQFCKKMGSQHFDTWHQNRKYERGLGRLPFIRSLYGLAPFKWPGIVSLTTW